MIELDSTGIFVWKLEFPRHSSRSTSSPVAATALQALGRNVAEPVAMDGQVFFFRTKPFPLG